ncbi:MAG TPA: hypothetical protein PK366_05390, partial [Fibrobacteraceae bacterium]|nr:hypothetical protein [Fibrobacteraceae bacterium]
YQDKTFIFYEDGTCSMLKNDSSDCSWELTEKNLLEINWEEENGEKDYIHGYLAILEGILLLLDLEDPADFFRQ